MSANNMGDLTNPRLIYAKGILFLICGLISAALLISLLPRWHTVVLLCVTIWSFCRCYYFAFYVIEHYIDGSFRFAGMLDFAKYCVTKNGLNPRLSPPQQSEHDRKSN